MFILYPWYYLSIDGTGYDVYVKEVGRDINLWGVPDRRNENKQVAKSKMVIVEIESDNGEMVVVESSQGTTVKWKSPCHTYYFHVLLLEKFGVLVAIGGVWLGFFWMTLL